MLEVVFNRVGLVVYDQSDNILAGDVLCGDNGEFVPRNFRCEADVADLAARAGCADGCAMEHAGQDLIVDIDRLPGDFIAALFARHWRADNVLSHVLVYRGSSPRFSFQWRIGDNHNTTMIK